MVVAGALVLAASAGLGWWLIADTASAPRNLSAEQLAKAGERPAGMVQTAAPNADAAQVRRAFEQFQVVYADLGREGLEAFSRDCAQAVTGDPRILDYCLAFDAFSGSVASDAAWFGDADLRHVELARAALPPGVEPAARIAEVRRLTRAALGVPAPVVVAQARPEPPTRLAPPPAAPAPAAAAVQRAAAPQPAPQPAPVRPKLQKAATAPTVKARAPVRKAANRCRFEPTPAARLLCQDPELRAADRRLKRAYERALAAGVDRQELDRQQAEWRTAQNANAASKDAVARAYQIRIGQLEATAQSAQ